MATLSDVPGKTTTAIVTSEGYFSDRSALATVRALGIAGRRAIVAASGPHSLAAASRFTTETVDIGPANHPDFAAKVRQVAIDHRGIAVFATSDPALSSLRPETDRLMDKVTLADDAEGMGLRSPVTHHVETSEELERVIDSVQLPAIVKPRHKVVGGPTAERVESRAQLRSAMHEPSLIQPYLEGETKALAGLMWNGTLVAAVQQRYVRTFPPTAGTASAAVTELVDEEWLAGLSSLLKDVDGIFQAQFVDGQLIDLNLRPYGSMSLATAAGINFPDLVCRLTAGETVDQRFGRPGIPYRWLDGDVRSVAFRLRHGQIGTASAFAALMPRRGTVHSVLTLADPRPGVVRLRRGR